MEKTLPAAPDLSSVIHVELLHAPSIPSQRCEFNDKEVDEFDDDEFDKFDNHG